MGSIVDHARRRLLRHMGNIAALGLALGMPQRQVFAAPRAEIGPRDKLPPRGHYLLRNAYIMTMERDIGDIAEGAVHVRDGRIVAIGKGVTAPGAKIIEGAGMIVLPGLVETHWHMWNTLLRSMSGERPDFGYFRTTAQLGQHYLADDMYKATRLAAAEAINSGITSVHDWCHNVRSPDYARAQLRALMQCGLRARFSYGAMQGHDNAKTIDLADIEVLHAEWLRWSNEGLMTLGLAWRGQGGNNPASAVPPEVYRAEFETAQRLKLPISVHASGSRAAIGQIEGLSRAGMLNRNVQVIHAVHATRNEIDAMRAAGVSASLSPFTELRVGFGVPPILELLEVGIPVGLSVDTVELSGNADMFAIMKMIQNLGNAKAESEFRLTARRTLELATIEGARSMGLGDVIGSLAPGKRADIIMVSTRATNLAVFGDPAHMLVTAAQPANVDTVIIDGRILKRQGRLTHGDARAIMREAAAANIALRKRANWW